MGVQCFSIKRVRKREGETLGDHDEQIEKEREKERFRQERSGLVVVLKGACHTHTWLVVIFMILVVVVEKDNYVEKLVTQSRVVRVKKRSRNRCC